MTDENMNILSDARLLPYKILKAGNLTCMYEAGKLRYIKYDEVEVIRMIYNTVRDENWETITANIIYEEIEENDNSFLINYTATYTTNEINYTASFHLQGMPDNTIIFSMEGLALNDFKKNRIGICVHHPLKECCGKETVITKPNDETYTSIFPELIAPHQPFKEVQQTEWMPAKNLHARLLFQGDIFETEDQRNWSDSSFKTYCTPLSLPFPAIVTKGDEIKQEVRLKITGDLKEAGIINTAQEKPIQIFPKIGYAKTPGKSIINKENIQVFNQYPFHHYRVEINMDNDLWKEALHTSFEEAGLLKTRLELILFFDEGYEQQLNLFIQSIQGFEQYIYSILLLQHHNKVTPAALMLFGYKCVKKIFPLIKVGYGTDAYFTELNRNRPGNLPHDFVSFSLTPQVHATDERTMIENLECQPDIIKTIKSFTDKPIHVSPVSFYKRKKFDAATGENFLMGVTGSSQPNFEKNWLAHCIQQLDGVECISLYR